MHKTGDKSHVIYMGQQSTVVTDTPDGEINVKHEDTNRNPETNKTSYEEPQREKDK